MRRTRHNIQHMDTTLQCACNDHIIFVNTQIIADQIAVETRPSGGPPFCELIHDISKEVDCEITDLGFMKNWSKLRRVELYGCEKLTDIPEKVDFFDALPDYDVALFTNKKSKTNPEVSKAMLEAAIPTLENVSDWTMDGVHGALLPLAAALGVKNATLLWPVRIAVSGRAVTPGGAVEICHILGKAETLRRLRAGLAKLS